MAESKEKKPSYEVKLKNVRLSFANIYKPQDPQTNDDGELVAGKYKANFLMPKGASETEANVRSMKAVVEAAKVAKWGKNLPKLKPDKVCLRDGDLEDWDGYAGQLYVSANNLSKPVVVKRNREAALAGEKGSPYPGCYVNAIVRVWIQDSPKYGKRVNATLEAVQFVSDGEPFGAKPVDPNDAFDDLGDDDGDGDGGNYVSNNSDDDGEGDEDSLV